MCDPTIAGLMICELLPFRWRAVGLGAAVFVNRITSAVVTLTALSLINGIGVPGFFLFYFVFALIGVVVSFVLVPETARASLDK